MLPGWLIRAIASTSLTRDESATRYPRSSVLYVIAGHDGSGLQRPRDGPSHPADRGRADLRQFVQRPARHGAWSQPISQAIRIWPINYVVG
jgi:hypothetical protein